MNKTNKGSAFSYRKNLEGKALNSVAFTDGQFLPLEKNTTSGLYNGFSMTFETKKPSEFTCDDLTKNATVKFVVHCNPEMKTKPEFKPIK